MSFLYVITFVLPCVWLLGPWQAQKSHENDLHAYLNPLWQRIATTHCVKCGLDFHDPWRLLKHLRRRGAASPCAAHYMEFVEPADPSDVAEFEKAEKAKKATRKKAKEVLSPPVLRYT